MSKTNKQAAGAAQAAEEVDLSAFTTDGQQLRVTDPKADARVSKLVQLAKAGYLAGYIKTGKGELVLDGIISFCYDAITERGRSKDQVRSFVSHLKVNTASNVKQTLEKATNWRPSSDGGIPEQEIEDLI